MKPGDEITAPDWMKHKHKFDPPGFTSHVAHCVPAGTRGIVVERPFLNDDGDKVFHLAVEWPKLHHSRRYMWGKGIAAVLGIPYEDAEPHRVEKRPRLADLFKLEDEDFAEWASGDFEHLWLARALWRSGAGNDETCERLAEMVMEDLNTDDSEYGMVLVPKDSLEDM